MQVVVMRGVLALLLIVSDSCHAEITPEQVGCTG